MGAVNFSIDPLFISMLKAALPLHTFVETGTYEGESVQRALSFFQQIYTVELSQEYYERAVQRFKGQEKVHVYHDDSAHFLEELRPLLEKTQVLFWLDAHWCAADESAGDNSQCPVLEELGAIARLGPQSAILIDDARLFLCPPPRPHEVCHWPSFDALVRKLFSLSRLHELMILNDVVMFFPSGIRPTVGKFAHENSIDWLSVLDKSRDYDSLEVQLHEKEKEIARLSVTAEKRALALTEKEKLISAIHQIAQDRARELTEKERTIADVHQVAEERAAQMSEKEEMIRTIDKMAHERAIGLSEKEGMIRLLKGVADDRATEIDKLLGIAEDRARVLQEKEKAIAAIHSIADERDRLLIEKETVIHLIHQELQTIKRHWAYRLVAKVKRLLETVKRILRI